MEILSVPIYYKYANIHFSIMSRFLLLFQLNLKRVFMKAHLRLPGTYDAEINEKPSGQGCPKCVYISKVISTGRAGVQNGLICWVFFGYFIALLNLQHILSALTLDFTFQM